MPEIVLGIASSHGPQLSLTPELWVRRADADRKNPELWYRGKTYSFPDLVDYVPCYRTEAGTGCAMGFAEWR